MRSVATAKSALLGLFLCLACTGCELIALSLGAPEEIRRAAGAAQCEGNACDPARWVTVNAYTGVTVRGVDATCAREYPLAFQGSPLAYQSISVDAANGLRLAIVTGGVVYIAPFGDSAATRSKDLHAVAAAWSNAGDRLAVATVDRAADTAALLILDDELNELDRFEIELSAGQSSRDAQQAFVSWNSTDTLVAATSLVSPPGSIVDLSGGAVQRVDVRALHFIGERQAVATDAERESVRVYTVDANEIHSGQAIAGARFTVASAPAAGVFLTTEPLLSAGPVQFNPDLGLHTVQSGPSIVYPRSSSGPIAIVSVDVARQTMSGLCEP